MNLAESEWLEKYLARVEDSSSEGKAAAEFVRKNKIKIGIKRANKSVGAFWTLNRKIYLNAYHYTQESTLTESNLRAITLFVHEVRHLQQGFAVALSVYGELDAWQYEFRLYKRLSGRNLSPILEELLTLPLEYNRATLRRAQKLMRQYAGFWYLIWLLPLYPITYRNKR
ncbi:MAG: hypothetical protein IT311_03965 [Anaerolineales bacterium]|nr:hypothetical protein [Anaerolineales bacterium]MCZ2121172.1 hypothetical protein [Anaerolineales bacterium]